MSERRLIDLAGELLHRRTGPLTRDPMLTPGRFGLGRVPERLAPDQATTMVCGFCSTGCGLKVHLRKGEAVNLSPAKDYPVNLGMACPKGWEALTPLQAADRATTPLLRGPNGKLHATTWENALGTFAARFKAIQAKHGAGSVACSTTASTATSGWR